MAKHVIRNLKLREISSVDRPAQVGAVSVLLKRAGDPTEELIKATFAEALKGNLLADKVRDAFWKAFEGQYEGKEAFRKALVDELAAGGDGTKASTAYKNWLGTLVDKARNSAIALNAQQLANVEDITKAFTDAADAWLEEQEEGQETIMKTKAELKAAITKALGNIDALTVGEVKAIHKAAEELKAEDELPATGPLAKGKTETDEDKDLKAKVERMTKRDALAADLRKHYDGLADDAARDAFLAKSADEQATEIAKAAGDDPVVYTTLSGVDIRKSAGDTVLALAKDADNSKRELAKAQAASEDVTLEKRANDDLGNIGGDLVGKKALLKALDSISDTATRDAATAVLKSANELAKGAFKKQGSTGSSADAAPATGNGDGSYEMSDAEAQIEEMAKAHAKDNKVSFEKAYSEVIQTEEGAQLYKRVLAGE